MKIKFLLFIILLYSTSAYSMWVDDWYNNVRRVQSEKYKKAAKTSVESSCVRRLKEYKELLKSNLNSKYYKWKVKSWTNRCNKEKFKNE